jgi:CheY-like chemotaxis protein
MDHMMPEMDGIEAVRIIREEIGTEYAKNIPIIALTANATIGSEKIFLENGFQAFISKPIDIAQLDAVIRQWLRNGAEAETDAETETSNENFAGPNMNMDMDELDEIMTELESFDYAAQAELIAWLREHVSLIWRWLRNKAPEKERMTEENEAEADAETPGENFAALNIGGFDAEKCLDRFGGDETTVGQVLRSYVVNTAPLLGKVREVTEETLPEYAIVVHGIKGSSRGICAESAGNMAESLEHAAKTGNMEFIRKNNGGFIETVEKLIDALHAALRSIEMKKDKPLKDAPDEALLEKLAECCESFDMDGIDEAMMELESFDYAVQADLIAWLREHVEKMEFSEIRTRLSAAA